MTGIRSGELLGLQVDDLDFERRLIFIRRSAWYGRLQTLKSKASRGTLPLPEPLAIMLKNYLETWETESAAIAVCESNRAAHERQQSRAA